METINFIKDYTKNFYNLLSKNEKKFFEDDYKIVFDKIDEEHEQSVIDNVCYEFNIIFDNITNFFERFEKKISEEKKLKYNYCDDYINKLCKKYNIFENKDIDDGTEEYRDYKDISNRIAYCSGVISFEQKYARLNRKKILLVKFKENKPKKSKILKKINNECCICYENFLFIENENIIFNCSHFNIHCEKCTKLINKCSICREKFNN